MILDYSTYLHHSNIQNSSYKWTLPDDTKLFYGKRGWCPFCKQNVSCVYENINNSNLAHIENIIWACSECGWWEQKTHYDDIGRMDEHLRYAILRNYEISEKNIPFDALNKHLKKNPRLLHELHPTKMEEVVQDVFSSAFQCEIHHCGQSNDGGIDLFYVESDIPIAIQVKRRQSNKSTEPVSLVRELLGAALISRYKGAVFVTTADHFSPAAIKVAEVATRDQIIQSFQLYDFNRFVSVLQLVPPDQDAPWKKFKNLLY